MFQFASIEQFLHWLKTLKTKQLEIAGLEINVMDSNFDSVTHWKFNFWLQRKSKRKAHLCAGYSKKGNMQKEKFPMKHHHHQIMI